MPSFSSEELFDNAHLKERGDFTEIDHLVMGETNSGWPSLEALGHAN